LITGGDYNSFQPISLAAGKCRARHARIGVTLFHEYCCLPESRDQPAITERKGEIMPVQKQGSTGPDVTNLQQKLKGLGVDSLQTEGNSKVAGEDEMTDW
jgi:hypothetical protein